jgi:hypothetical protein
MSAEDFDRIISALGVIVSKWNDSAEMDERNRNHLMLESLNSLQFLLDQIRQDENPNPIRETPSPINKDEIQSIIDKWNEGRRQKFNIDIDDDDLQAIRKLQGAVFLNNHFLHKRRGKNRFGEYLLSKVGREKGNPGIRSKNNILISLAAKEIIFLRKKSFPSKLIAHLLGVPDSSIRKLK